MHLIWLDFETTGLDPNEHHIIEVAAYSAPFLDPTNLKLILSSPVYCSEFDLSKMSSFVRDMHSASGLLEEVRGGDCMRIEWVEERLAEHVTAFLDAGEEQPTLAGSSIHFDRSFIVKHMPSLTRLLSHRLYDVSAIKLEAESLGMPRIPKALAHRADDDIKESIRHLQLVREWRSQGNKLARATQVFFPDCINLKTLGTGSIW